MKVKFNNVDINEVFKQENGYTKIYLTKLDSLTVWDDDGNEFEVPKEKAKDFFLEYYQGRRETSPYIYRPNVKTLLKKLGLFLQ
jgi:hypothetical protein